MWIAGYGLEEHSMVPKRSRYVRGMNGPGGYVIAPIPGQPERCDVCWILNADLRGWVPRGIVDSSYAPVLISWALHLRKALR
jgi:hypothetical protein